jgi:Raf kinase inhibitor-like YbhB/YbcL family protein
LRISFVIGLMLAAALAGCGSSAKGGVGSPPAAPNRISLSSDAFADGRTIPKDYTCDGERLTPPLAWSGVPSNARSLALVMEDPDAPGGTFVHWTLFGITTEIDSLAPGEIPQDAIEGQNSFGRRGYGAPCPPQGDKPHHYVVILYALRRPLALGKGAAPNDVIAAIKGTAIARGELTGRYGRR